METILDCGHAPSAHESFTTGYGINANGKKHCYACCAEHDRVAMLADGRATLYLTEKGITNWPGSLVFPILGSPNVKPHGGGFGAQRTDAWFVGPDRFVWHAINRGDSQIARCRRTKEIWNHGKS